MSEIICDTTVWYHDECTQPRFNKMFTATFINIFELAISENMYENTGLWKNALKRILDAPAYYHYATPSEFLSHSGFKHEIDHKSYTNQVKAVLNSFCDILDIKPVEFKPEIVQYLDEKNVVYKTIHENMNKLIVDSRAKYVENPITIPLEEAQILFRKNFCEHLLPPQNNIDYTKIDWTEFELFEKTGIQLFHELNVGNVGNGVSEWDVNDYDDLCNLIYVSPRDQYYVIEKKWIKLIERAGMNKYIFTPQPI